MTKIFLIGSCALFAVPSFAGDLWNQQVGLTLTQQTAVTDDIFTDFPNDSSYELSNITVGSQGWNITSISEYFVLPYTQKSIFSEASIELMSGGLSLPTSNPTVLTTADVTSKSWGANTSGNPVYLLTAVVNINVNAGNYWIGFTPTGMFSSFGESYSYFSTSNNAGATVQDAWINPGGGQGSGTGYHELENYAGASNPCFGSIDIQGTPQAAPEPISVVLVGFGALGLVARRRRLVGTLAIAKIVKT